MLSGNYQAAGGSIFGVVDALPCKTKIVIFYSLNIEIPSLKKRTPVPISSYQFSNYEVICVQQYHMVIMGTGSGILQILAYILLAEIRV